MGCSSSNPNILPQPKPLSDSQSAEILSENPQKAPPVQDKKEEDKIEKNDEKPCENLSIHDKKKSLNIIFGTKIEVQRTILKKNFDDISLDILPQFKIQTKYSSENLSQIENNEKKTPTVEEICIQTEEAFIEDNTQNIDCEEKGTQIENTYKENSTQVKESVILIIENKTFYDISEVPCIEFNDHNFEYVLDLHFYHFNKYNT